MKRKWLIVAVAPLFFTGCFSAMERSGEAWGGGKDSSARTKSAAADVVTLPFQAPYLATHSGTYSPISKAQAEDEKHLMSLLENDPEIAINQRWDRINSHPQGKMAAKPDDSHRRVFIASFSNQNVKYTQDQLETIYSNMPAVSDYVFCSRGCSAEFLASHFDEAYNVATWMSYTELACIIFNPNTPLELVEKIASAQNLPAGLTMPAQHALYQRRVKANATSVSP